MVLLQRQQLQGMSLYIIVMLYKLNTTFMKGKKLLKVCLILHCSLYRTE